MSDTVRSPRCAVIVGPYLSGKTTLLESMLMATGGLHRKGSVKDGTTLGDSSPEARARQMSVELTAAATTYLGEEWTFIDCPGSIEFAQETRDATMVADVAVVVVDPDPTRALTAAPILKFLDRNRIPHLVFINKTDHPGIRLRDTLAALQEISERPLILREAPIREGEQITGFVDLVSEKAYEYLDGAPSKMVRLPDSARPREQEAREEMLEALADFDDRLLEELLEETPPPTGEIYDNLTRDLQEDLIVPVFFGSAEHDHGIRRLLKALRHETPESDAAAHRLGLDPAGGEVLAQVFKTQHLPHAGKYSLARLFDGGLKDGDTLAGQRLNGLYRPFGDKHEKCPRAKKGAVVGLGRLDGVKTGEVLGTAAEGLWPEPMPPVFAAGLTIDRHADEVKLAEALQRMTEEDRSLTTVQKDETGQLLLMGQGDIHLKVAVDRLKNRYHLEVTIHPEQTPYQETIRKSAKQHGRYKKQTGGHGQFGDVHLTIKPLPRGEGFAFTESIVGGVVPRQYIPAVEKGVRDYLRRGPLGFPVVDLTVELFDGSYHSVDSSDQAFQMAARIAMNDAMPECDPVLLEPINLVTISTPNEFTSKIQRLISSRRGQILGFDAKPGWGQWDEVKAYMPHDEIRDMITELRSLTLGVGFFDYSFDHMQELSGKQADRVVSERQAALKG